MPTPRSPRILRGRRAPRRLRWCVALASEESTIIHRAAAEAGMATSAWGREALLRAALRQPVPAPTRPPSVPSETSDGPT